MTHDTALKELPNNNNENINCNMHWDFLWNGRIRKFDNKILFFPFDCLMTTKKKYVTNEMI